MINITRVNHTALNTTSDVEEIKEFYCKHLGAETVPRDIPPEYEEKIPGFWMQFENGQVHIIKNSDPGGIRNPLGPHIAFYVSSLAETESYLKDNGVEYDRMNQFIFLSDPAGNTIELQQDPDYK
jgi:catechol 2,3-dioxygenase-like lactoylglutathione lyase family enzyme